MQNQKSNYQVRHLRLPGNNIKTIYKKRLKVTYIAYKLSKI